MIFASILNVCPKIRNKLVQKQVEIESEKLEVTISDFVTTFTSSLSFIYLFDEKRNRDRKNDYFKIYRPTNIKR